MKSEHHIRLSRNFYFLTLGYFFLLSCLTCHNETKTYYKWSATITEDGIVLYNGGLALAQKCDGRPMKEEQTGYWKMDCLDSDGEYYQAYGTIYSTFKCDEDGNYYSVGPSSGLTPLEIGDCFKVPPAVKEKLRLMIDKMNEGETIRTTLPRE